MPPKKKKGYSPKKAKKHIKKAVKKTGNRGKNSAMGLPKMSSTSNNRKTDAKPTKYSPEGEWMIMHDGSSRRAIPASKRNKENKPYKGWR